MSGLTGAATLKVYFDLSAEDRWVQGEWERNLSALSPDPAERIELVSDFNRADVTIRPRGPQIVDGTAREEVSGIADGAPNVLVWDSHDFPTGRYNGIYCSLDKRIFDPERHASFPYPYIFNELVGEGDIEEAIYDFVFYGAFTSGVRRRLIAKFRGEWVQLNALCQVANTPWLQIFDRSGLDIKRNYADALKKGKFILCPRGNGVGTIRLFEVLKTGRVPIILSDRYVLPPHIDWKSCSIVLPESQLASIPAVVSNAIDRWPVMARAARKVWEDNFSDAGLLGYMGKVLPPLAKNRGDTYMTSMIKGRHLIGLGRVAMEMRLKRQAGRILSKFGR